ncbi:MAG: hypothetical protein M1812_000412 [Candelaria pacifica]|nr:MAG: hypothetical protein M1812_000412 [Candelaria pacifica]
MTPIPPTISASSVPAHFSNNITNFQPSHPQSKWTAETISTVGSGIVALVVGTVTIWQAHRTWKLWHESRTTGHITQQDEADTGSELPNRSNTGVSISEELHSASEVDGA